MSTAARFLREALAEAIEEEGPTPCQTSDPDMWFANTSRTKTAEAVNLCRVKCPVRDLCLAYAMAADERFGVWGGQESGDGKPLLLG